MECDSDSTPSCTGWGGGGAAEEIPVARPLISPWQRSKHIERKHVLYVAAVPAELRPASQRQHCVPAARRECLQCEHTHVLICPHMNVPERKHNITSANVYSRRLPA